MSTKAAPKKGATKGGARRSTPKNASTKNKPQATLPEPPQEKLISEDDFIAVRDAVKKINENGGMDEVFKMLRERQTRTGPDAKPEETVKQGIPAGVIQKDFISIAKGLDAQKKLLKEFKQKLFDIGYYEEAKVEARLDENKISDVSTVTGKVSVIDAEISVNNEAIKNLIEHVDHLFNSSSK